MEFPKERLINKPKFAPKVCFRCKSSITEEMAEEKDVYSRVPGKMNYYHPDCFNKAQVEKLVYNIVKEARQGVRVP